MKMKTENVQMKANSKYNTLTCSPHDFKFRINFKIKCNITKYIYIFYSNETIQTKNVTSHLDLPLRNALTQW